MKTPPEQDQPDPADLEFTPELMEAYQAWLDENPRHAEAIMDFVRQKMEEKGDSLPPEKRAEVEALTRQLGEELAEEVVPLHYNPLADRLYALIEQQTLSDDEVDELKAMTGKLDRLLDMSLDLAEPRRTEVIATLTSTRQQLQLVLGNLTPAPFEMQSDDDDDEEDEDEEDKA